ncbi:hypothetical protein EYB26_002742 [Talaromyces marneffei]|uniref:uncharacterized protein n=1 Tax=Talaromyces marneffei TaxID=37727 RepID=UPI0012A94654|nr:uncharacterized protein EYB26_002742 [Talaromyces marneffei]QGA15086.1 hypothetical protein EYB26_002742 [Talaromyces marneffei]
MVIKIKVSKGAPVFPAEDGGASTGAPSVEPNTPATTSQTKQFLPFSESRNKPRFRGQKRNWYKRRNDKGKQSQRASQPEDGSRSHQYQNQRQHQYQLLHQHRPPVKLLDRPDYFNFNPSNGLHTPGPIHPRPYGFGSQPVGYLSPPPLLMPMPMPSPLRFDYLHRSTLPVAVLSQEYPKPRFWDEIEAAIPLWSPPQSSIDHSKIWTRQAGYHPLYYQYSTLRPWATEFVPGRLFHPILGW